MRVGHKGKRDEGSDGHRQRPKSGGGLILLSHFCTFDIAPTERTFSTNIQRHNATTPFCSMHGRNNR